MKDQLLVIGVAWLVELSAGVFVQGIALIFGG